MGETDQTVAPTADQPEDSATDSFPRQHARTQRLTLGSPRNFSVSPDGSVVLFLRSQGGSDAVTYLWAFDTEDDGGSERLIVDPSVLLAEGADEDLPEAELRRRERAREGAGGIVGYAVDAEFEQVCFALGGSLYVSPVRGDGPVISLPAVTGTVFDPRLDPTGTRIAYVSGRELRVVELGDDPTDRQLVGEDPETISWGSAEFIAAEEMRRSRGYWWSPDGGQLAVARVDVSPVSIWHIADPANPDREPIANRYPAAGTANADVTLAVCDLDGAKVDIAWDRSAFPYLADVQWPVDSPLTLVVQSRDQRTLVVLTADVETGDTVEIHRQVDEHWVELVPGAPRWFADQLVTVVDRDGARRLVVGHKPVTPAELQVRAIVGVLADDLLITASSEPMRTNLYRVSLDGDLRAVSEGPGVHSGVSGGEVVVVSSSSMAHPGVRVKIRRDGDEIGEIKTLAEQPLVEPNVAFHIVGAHRLRSALLLPESEPDGPLPILLDPYGGPHAQRVVRAHNAFLAPQWFADQGFAVIVTDGRGTPGRGPEFERAVRGDLAQPVLDDQIEALHELAADDDRLDLSRVGIRGWSFGGYLAALAVMRRPDVFHAGIAGAPVIDWALYDTHYTERYLGHPDEEPENYRRSSVLEDAPKLERSLLLIHGLADDNVVAAHTLRLSSALLAAGKTHEVLPLSGVTHMTPQEVVAENLLRFQVDFLHRSLAAIAD